MARVVECDLKAPFLLTTTLRYRGGCYSIPWISLLTLDLYLIILSVKQGSREYHFLESLLWLDLGLNPGLPGHWWTLYPLVGWGCRIHWLHLCSGVRPTYKCPGYDSKQSGGEASVMLEPWLVHWVLWHINLCRLFNASSQFHFKQFSLA